MHMFDIGRFREETMAFPPSVTVKDYTWAGSLGYLNPKRGAEPARFRTIIQIVPAPPGDAEVMLTAAFSIAFDVDRAALFLELARLLRHALRAAHARGPAA